MLKKLPGDILNEEMSLTLMKNLQKHYNKRVHSAKDINVKPMMSILSNYMIYICIYQFQQK